MAKNNNQYGTKEEKIRYFLEKGPEWMAEQLWLARKENHKLREDYNRENMEYRRDGAEKHALQEANNRLANVISKNGIKPVRYIMHYIVPCVIRNSEIWRSNCDAYETDSTECDDCPDRTEITGSVSFYDFSIEDGWIEAIDEELNEFGASVLSLKNEKTGATIYKRKRVKNGQGDD